MPDSPTPEASPREPAPLPAGRIAGIDFGTVRIGVAITDARGSIASPLANYTRRGAEGDALWFRRLAADEKIVRFVVGLPVHSDGREGQKSQQARKFGDWLTETTGVPVEYFDERFTSREAQQLLSEAGVPAKRRKEKLDMLAAQILLQGWLESSRSGEAPGRLDA